MSSDEEEKYVFDAESATETARLADWFQNGEIAMQMAKPLLLKTDLLSEEDFDRSYQEMMAEMYSNDVYSMTLLLTVWGRVPG